MACVQEAEVIDLQRLTSRVGYHLLLHGHAGVTVNTMQDRLNARLSTEADRLCGAVGSNLSVPLAAAKEKCSRATKRLMIRHGLAGKLTDTKIQTTLTKALNAIPASMKRVGQFPEGMQINREGLKGSDLEKQAAKCLERLQDSNLIVELTVWD